MTLPAVVRVNALFPFPATVTGTAPIVVGKLGGIWTVGLNIGALGTVVPLASQYPTDFLLLWDSIAMTFSKVSLSSLGIAGARAQRSVTTSPIFIAPTDQILNVNISTGSPTCALPAANLRGGVPLTFKDVGGQFSAHPLTISGSGGDLIDGAASQILNANYQGVTLYPANDGVNSGWFSE